MKEYDKLMSDIKILLEEYFRTKEIETDFQVYEDKISGKAYYNNVLIAVNIINDGCFVRIFLNSYFGYINNVATTLIMDTMTPLSINENDILYNVTYDFKSLFSRLERIIDESKNILEE